MDDIKRKIDEEECKKLLQDVNIYCKTYGTIDTIFEYCEIHDKHLKNIEDKENENE